MSISSNEYKKGFFYIFIAIFIFSTFEVASRSIINIYDPFQINFIRFLAGGIILLIVSVIKGTYKVPAKEIKYLILLGVVNVTLSLNFSQFAISLPDGSASLVAVIFSANPIFVTIFLAMSKEEKITLKKVIALLLGFFGIIMIFSGRLSSGYNLLCPILAVVSSALYALYTVIGRKIVKRVDNVAMNAWSFIAGSLVMLPFMLIFKKPVIPFDLTGVWRLIYLAVVVTGIGYVFYFKGLSITGTGRGALMFFLKPVIATVLAVIFLQEDISLFTVVGIVFVAASIVVVNIKINNK